MLNGPEIPLFLVGRQHWLKLNQTGNPEAAILWIRKTEGETHIVWRRTVLSYYTTQHVNAVSMLGDRKGKEGREGKKFITPASLDKT